MTGLTHETPPPVDVHDTGIITWWVSRQLISRQRLDATMVDWTVERSCAAQLLYRAALNVGSTFLDFQFYRSGNLG